MRPSSVVLAASLLALSVPALAAKPEVAVEPRRIVLGEQTSVEVRVRTAGLPGKLRAAASMGTLSPAEGAAQGEARFTWTPPDTRIPATALLMFWTEDDEVPPDVSVTRLSLVGRTDLEISTEPGAEVKVMVAGKVFGPATANSRGSASVPIEVPPGVTEAKVLGKRHGTATEVAVPLGVPAFNPLAAILGPEEWHAGRRGWLWVFDASDFYADKLQVAFKGGDARLAETTREGTLFEISTPPRSRRISAAATAKGNPNATAQVSMKLLPPIPGTQAPPEPPSEVQNLEVDVPDREPPAEAKQAEPAPLAQAPSALSRLQPGALAGGFYGGGAILGLAAALQLGYPLGSRFAVEIELGVRRSSLTTMVPQGALQSQVVAIPATAGGRLHLFESGRWAFDLRLGAGALPFVHVASSAFQATVSETALSWEAFGSGEIGYRLGPVRAFLELRGSYSPVSTPQLFTRMGGVFLALGARGVSP